MTVLDTVIRINVAKVHLFREMFIACSVFRDNLDVYSQDNSFTLPCLARRDMEYRDVCQRVQDFYVRARCVFYIANLGLDCRRFSSV